jgi:hypothetical protein
MSNINYDNLKRVIKKSMISEQEEDDNNKGGSFKKMVEKILHSRTQTHIFHLQTKSYAEHIALDGFYNGVLPLFDGLVESYQGKHGIITNYECDGFEDYSSGEQVIKYLQTLANDIEKLRESIKESYIQNQIDTVEELIFSTVYKLRFLK